MTTALLLSPLPAHARPHNLTTWARYEHFHLQKRIERDDLRRRTDLLKVLPRVHQSIWHDWRVFDEKYDALEAQVLAPALGDVAISWEKTYATGYIQRLICSYDWSCSIALSVFGCESGFSPYADNPDSSAFGIAQNLGETSTDPKTQLDHAWAKYVAAGYSWGPWDFGCLN